MSIWFRKDIDITAFSGLEKNTMIEHLGIQFTELGDNYIKATMPVDHRTHQPHGLLHGGASVVLAETLGSFGSALTLDPEKYIPVGLEINANHIRSTRHGIVTGTASPLHLGKSTQVWEIKIHDEHQRLLCVSRITTAILEKD
jgi:1,4-dihydroxy-2-naphthoyl-CoA hydrolase